MKNNFCQPYLFTDGISVLYSTRRYINLETIINSHLYEISNWIFTSRLIVNLYICNDIHLHSSNSNITQPTIILYNLIIGLVDTIKCILQIKFVMH